MAVTSTNPAKQILQSDLDKAKSACPDSLPSPAKRPTTYQEIVEFEATIIHPFYFACAAEARGIIQQVEKIRGVD